MLVYPPKETTWRYPYKIKIHYGNHWVHSQMYNQWIDWIYENGKGEFSIGGGCVEP